jgi:arylsulfotransferase ASST
MRLWSRLSHISIGALPACFLVAASFLCGVIVERTQLWLPRSKIRQESRAAPQRFGDSAGKVEGLAGRWHVTRVPPSTRDEPEELRRLGAIGYLGAVDRAPRSTGVTHLDRARAYPGLNLYTSGHAPEATLMDMDGRVWHRWTHSYDQAFHGHAFPWTPSGREHWRRVALLSDGGLLAIHEGQGLVRLTSDSRLEWALSIAAHHDLAVTAGGEIYVLTREARSRSIADLARPVLEDFITVISPDGHIRRQVSLLECFVRSRYAPLLANLPRSGDLFHTNTLAILENGDDKWNPAFQAGNVLISIPTLNVIAVVDLDTAKVVWALTGLWSFQHDPSLLDGGRILLLDNQGIPGASRVLEIDSATQAIVWSYQGDDRHPFYTRFCGAVHRLPNGNTLVAETDRGRAFEIDPDGVLVWEFLNPHRGGRSGELIASIFDVVRVAVEDVQAWLPRTKTPDGSVAGQVPPARAAGR